MKNIYHNFSNYKIINKHISKNIDLHIFLLCKNYQKDLQNISKLFHISKFPKKIFDDFHGEKGDMITHYLDQTKLLFIGYGKNKNCDPQSLYEIFLQLGKSLSNTNQNILIHLLHDDDEYIIHHQISGFITGYYKFDFLKSNHKTKILKNSIYFYTPKRKVIPYIEKYTQLSLIQNEVRNYMNLPSNLLRIKDYISFMKQNLPKNVSIQVISKKMLQKLGMNLLLAVNQGSNQDCALVVLTYKKNVKKSDQPICFIGKGVMFDSGGYDIKIRSMLDMKYDMSSSAIVYGIIKSHATLQSNGHYIGLLPLVENMIGKDAIRPSDVIISHSGKSVEITNTDAEGRLVIADCMSYSKKFNPKLLIDIGTLAGDTAHMFANKSSVIMGNHYKYNKEIIEIGKKYHEKIWELPMWEEYLEDIESDVADVRNSGKSNMAGSIIVGAFLSHFVPKDKKGEEIPWVHLDIAGMEVVKGSSLYHNGGKVETLKTLCEFTKDL